VPEGNVEIEILYFPNDVLIGMAMGFGLFFLGFFSFNGGTEWTRTIDLFLIREAL